MSFGFSVGDFIATAVLIKKIVSVLHASSSSEYKELQDELFGLQQALDAIENLECPSNRTIELNAIKVAALSCHHFLDEFSKKAVKYKVLTEEHKQRGWQASKLWGRKLQWGFTMQEEVRCLRTYIAAHVGYLNMHLATFNVASITAMNEQMIAQTLASTRGLSDEIQSVASSADEHNVRLDRVSVLLENLMGAMTSSVVVPLKALVVLAGKIWTTNTQIVQLLIALQTNSPSPNTRFTWFQPPVRFENALGVTLPVPTEYNTKLLHAIIREQFRSGPGEGKVECGEYELFNASDTTQTISLEENSPLIPGMNITMAFCIGTYKDVPLRQCPRPGCGTPTSMTYKDGTRSCSACGVCYALSPTPLPRPFRLPQHLDGFTKMRSERKWFKNVRVYPNEMPSILLAEDSQLRLLSSVSKIERELASIVARTLDIAVEEITMSKPLFMYGIDSIYAVEVRSWILQKLEADFSIFDILGGKSVSELSNQIAERSKIATIGTNAS